MNTTAISAYIGLGSNLQQPETQLNRALVQMNTLSRTQLVQISSFYRSKPLGPRDQPDYLNAVVELATSLPPRVLLDKLQAIETAQGRDRSQEIHWGARTLDLDVLLYGNKRIHTSRLRVPHSGLRERAFVVIPLAEIAPQLVLPDGEILSVLAQSVPGRSALVRLTKPNTEYGPKDAHRGEFVKN